MEKDGLKLSIIIVNWNTRDLLKQCLESLINELTKLRINGLKAEIIVVDNGSTDGSVDYINGLTKLRINGLTIKKILNKENLGFAAGNNIGIKQAEGKYIMLLNSDTIVKDGAIEKMLTFLHDREEISIVGPRLLNADRSFQANCGKFPDLWVSFVMLFKEHFGGSDLVRCSPKQSCFVDWLMGAAFVARREVFEKVGGLDENIFMYMEEVEWFYRAKNAGFKTYFYKEAEIIHLSRGSSKSGKTEPILNIYKGLIYFYKKHMNFLAQLLLKMMLKIKALTAIGIGYIKNDDYLKETYGKAFKIN